MSLNDEMRFRLAEFGDAGILLKWRNDPLTRKSSKNSSLITMKQHIRWLTASFKDKNRRINIVEYNKIPVGTIRTDYSEGFTELSWTVAPEARGQGIGKRMVMEFMRFVDGPVRAEIKVGNEASKRIAEGAGMKLDREEKGILYYSVLKNHTLSSKPK
jgi:RimJ/RimL family protein N-acetyltransferase